MNRESRLPRKALWLWQIRCGLLTALPVTAFLFASLYRRVFLIPPAVLFLLSLWVICFYLPRYFAAFRLESSADGLTVRRGVWFQETFLLPPILSVYTVTVSTPLARVFGLSAVSVKMIRGWLWIPELETAQIEKIFTEGSS